VADAEIVKMDVNDIEVEEILQNPKFDCTSKLFGC